MRGENWADFPDDYLESIGICEAEEFLDFLAPHFLFSCCNESRGGTKSRPGAVVKRRKSHAVEEKLVNNRVIAI